MDRKNKLLILSFLLLNLYNWIALVEVKYGIPSIVKYLLAVFVIGTIIRYRLSNPLKPAPGELFYPFIIVFIIWSVILLVSQSLRINNFFYIQRILGQPFFFIPYLLPLFLLYAKFDLDFISCFFKYSYLVIFPAILVQFYIVLTGISHENWSEQVARIRIFELGSSFLLLTAQISKKKYVFSIVLFYTLLMIFLYTQFGRRGVIIEYMFLLFFMIIIRLRSTLLNFSHRVKIYFVGLLMIVLIPTFGYLVTSTYAFQRGFTKEALEESRGSAFEAFFYDFNSTSDWIFGRGLEGRVLRAISMDDDEYRTYDLIENGLLTLLLKGGLLYMVPFMLILLRASYLGFFRSKNDLVKALASMIIIYLIIMLYFNVPVFATKYIFLWISVSICFTPELRNLSDEKIYEAINK